MALWWAVAIGGALGAVCRYGLSGFLQKLVGTSLFPWGTLGVNFLGCFVMGLLLPILGVRAGGDPLRVFCLVGVLGGFTTFSAFGLELLDLLERHALGPALLYLAGSAGLGVLAVWGGQALVRATLPPMAGGA